jgi:hypothetical protein
MVFLFGLGLAVLGIYIFFNSSLTLPTRSPPRLFHFFGFSRYLLGGATLLFGAVAIAVAAGRLSAESRWAQFAIGAGIVLLGIAFISAPRY